MIVQSACQSASTRVVATKDLRRPKCPDCGSVLLIAEESPLQPSRPHRPCLVM